MNQCGHELQVGISLKRQEKKNNTPNNHSDSAIQTVCLLSRIRRKKKNHLSDLLSISNPLKMGCMLSMKSYAKCGWMPSPTELLSPNSNSILFENLQPNWNSALDYWMGATSFHKYTPQHFFWEPRIKNRVWNFTLRAYRMRIRID